MSDFLSYNNSEYVGNGESSALDEESNSLEIDDSLSVLEKIKKYIDSDIVLQRLYVVRTLTDACKEVGIDNFKEKLLPILESLKNESEIALRQALLEQIPDIAKFFYRHRDSTIHSESTTSSNSNSSLTTNNHDNKEPKRGEIYEQEWNYEEQGYKLILETLVPIIAQLTVDNTQQVRNAAGESLIQVASLIKTTDIEIHILPIIRSLANDNTDEDSRHEASLLLVHISEYLGEELSKKYIVPLVVKLSDDSSFRVRKAISQYFGKICKCVGSFCTTEVLLPVYFKLCKDDIWGVRKACVESIIPIGEVVPKNERKGMFNQLFDMFMDDQSRWVKGAAYQCVGNFIALLPGSEVEDKLLKYYTSMALDENVKRTIGEDITQFCAFNFPAVLLTLGSSRWDLLKETYFTLVKDSQWKVRRSLSCSLHEVAKILGSSQTEGNLLSVLDFFLKDIDEVKSGVIANFSSFLQVLDLPLRNRFLPLLADLQTHKNWRFRKSLAKQLGVISSLFEMKDIEEHIVTIVLHLCLDSVADVRKAASRGLGTLLNRLIAQESKMKAEVLRQLLSFATHPSCFRRQLYLMICNHLHLQIEDKSLFENSFLPRLLALKNDPVVIVRIGLAQMLPNLLSQEYLSKIPAIKETIQALQQDKDEDVSYYASHSERPKKNLFKYYNSNAKPPHIPDGKMEENTTLSNANPSLVPPLAPPQVASPSIDPTPTNALTSTDIPSAPQSDNNNPQLTPIN